VATDASGVCDAVLGGEAGFLAGPSIDEVARAIVTLATEEANAKHTRDRCHDTCRQIVWTRCTGKTCGHLAPSVGDDIDRSRLPPGEIRSLQTASIQPAYSDLRNA